MVGGKRGMVGSRMVDSPVFDKNALAIRHVVALVTLERVGVMYFYHMILKLAQGHTHSATYWTGGSGWG